MLFFLHITALTTTCWCSPGLSVLDNSVLNTVSTEYLITNTAHGASTVVVMAEESVLFTLASWTLMTWTDACCTEDMSKHFSVLHFEVLMMCHGQLSKTFNWMYLAEGLTISLFRPGTYSSVSV